MDSRPSVGRWRLSYDGQGVSLHPSVGSGSLPCRSHYFVRDNQVRWARWSKVEAERARERDRADTEAFFTADPPTAEQESFGTPQGRRRWPSARRVWHWLRGASGAARRRSAGHGRWPR